MVQVLSDREFILQQVVRILVESADNNNGSNLVLQLALTELVKQVMREMAQNTEVDNLQGNLLQKAIQTTMQLIGARAETGALPLDISPYFERISRSQRWVAKEMTELGLRLRQSRNSELLCSPRIVSNAPVPFQVIELGTREMPEGLIAYPMLDCRLNLERIREEYRVRGGGYPWEVEIGEITFVVETDGSLITFLEGFPHSVMEQARSALEQLACDLYDAIEV